MFKLFSFVLLVALLKDFAKSSSDNLESVVVLYRHGDRAPLAPYKNDPFDESYWPLGFGQLTNIGKRQQYALGQWLRERYSDFLSDRYNKSDIKVFSSNVDRCLMSAGINLAGLYPPKEDQVWNNNLKWQPVPVHTTPEKEDALLAQERPCPKYAKLFNELMESDFFASILRNYRSLFQYTSENSGENITTLEQFLYLHDTLYIEDLYNLTLPDWTSKVLNDQIEHLNEFAWTSYAYTTDLARLRAGPLIDLITFHFENVTHNVSGTPKFLMLSAHDGTIAPLLTALRLYDSTLPHYTATVIFELRKEGENNFVNIFYKNPTDVANLTLPDCDFNCGFDDFKKILEPVRITLEDWEKECLATD